MENVSFNLNKMLVKSISFRFNDTKLDDAAMQETPSISAEMGVGYPDGFDIESAPENDRIPVSADLSIKFANAEVEFSSDISAYFTIAGSGLSYTEFINSEGIGADLGRPLFAKASQLIANLTADSSAFPLIIDLNEHVKTKGRAGAEDI